MTAPLDRSATWPYDAAGEPGTYSYARAEQPNAVSVERVLGALEGGRVAALPGRDGRRDRRRADDAAARAGRSRSPRAPTTATGSCSTTSRPWGVNVVEYDQTGPPPAGADLILIEAPSNPMLTMPDFEAAAAHAGTRRLRCDALLAAPPAPARARLRRLAAQRHEGARGPRRPHRRASPP